MGGWTGVGKDVVRWEGTIRTKDPPTDSWDLVPLYYLDSYVPYQVAEDIYLNGYKLYIDDDDDSYLQATSDDTVKLYLGGQAYFTYSDKGKFSITTDSALGDVALYLDQNDESEGFIEFSASIGSSLSANCILNTGNPTTATLQYANFIKVEINNTKKWIQIWEEVPP